MIVPVQRDNCLLEQGNNGNPFNTSDYILAKEATAAKKQVDARVVHYFDFLRKNGIDKKEINTANIEIHPEYDYPKNEEKVIQRLSCITSDSSHCPSTE